MTTKPHTMSKTKEYYHDEIERGMKEKAEKLSSCCGVPAKGNGDNDGEDYGICPDCKEHCQYQYLIQTKT